MPPLPADFYDRPVLAVARELVGCVVAHGGVSGTIVETEAYHESEPACHAFVGLTPRTKVLFGPPGKAYVYRSYGIHALLNAVCEPEGVGAAVLIRALAPLDGLELMRTRREAGVRHRSAIRSRLSDRELCSGPGKLTQALGIELSENASSLQDGPVLILPGRSTGSLDVLAVAPRVGINKAIELPWRFCLAGDPNVSSPRPGPAAVASIAASRRG
jgi:DNA-3-methyladenine glycosylase